MRNKSFFRVKKPVEQTGREFNVGQPIPLQKPQLYISDDTLEALNSFIDGCEASPFYLSPQQVDWDVHIDHYTDKYKVKSKIDFVPDWSLVPRVLWPSSYIRKTEAKMRDDKDISAMLVESDGESGDSEEESGSGGGSSSGSIESENDYTKMYSGEDWEDEEERNDDE